MNCQRFCVLTVGRAGSTWLMQTLAGFPEVAVPDKLEPCPDNELLHPQRLAGGLAAYSRRLGRPLTGTDELIEGFWAATQEWAYAGFKSMPERHPDFRRFAGREDIRFITLHRRDSLAAAASFVAAKLTGSWERRGGPYPERWTYDPARHRPVLAATLHYVAQANAALASVPNAIRLSYEELCEPGFASAELDGLFGRPVRLAHARPPTPASASLANWEVFAADARVLGGGRHAAQ